MNCDAVKERLLDCFGDPELPRELADHIRQCDDCRAEWEKLRALAVQMPPDSDFFLSDAEADRFVVKVAQAISRTEQRGDNEIRNPRITRLFTALSWSRALPTAAAVVLLVGMSLIGQRSQRLATEPSTLSVETVIADEVNIAAYDEPDDDMVSALISKYSSEQDYGASEALLNDITEEEFEYLMDSFDPGDML